VKSSVHWVTDGALGRPWSSRKESTAHTGQSISPEANEPSLGRKGSMSQDGGNRDAVDIEAATHLKLKAPFTILRTTVRPARNSEMMMNGTL